MSSLPLVTAVCVSSAALVGFASLVGSSDAHESPVHETAGLRCLVVTHDLGDAVEISGKVIADHSVSGDYSFSIRHASSSGNAVIDQSGPFTVDAGRTTTLGQATLGGSARSYDADLSLTVGGAKLRCFGAHENNDI
jgi:hypothetical protein